MTEFKKCTHLIILEYLYVDDFQWYIYIYIYINSYLFDDSLV